MSQGEFKPWKHHSRNMYYELDYKEEAKHESLIPKKSLTENKSPHLPRRVKDFKSKNLNICYNI